MEIIDLNLQTNLNCPICMDVLAAPFILGCGHTFCFSCLQSCFEKFVSCPSCRAPVISLPVRNLVMHDILTVCAEKMNEKERILSRLKLEFEKSKMDNIWKCLQSKIPKIGLRDSEDDVLRCSECNWELVDNVCVGCGALHDATGSFRGYERMFDTSQFDSEDGSVVHVYDEELDRYESDGFVVHLDSDHDDDNQEADWKQNSQEEDSDELSDDESIVALADFRQYTSDIVNRDTSDDSISVERVSSESNLRERNHVKCITIDSSEVDDDSDLILGDIFKQNNTKNLKIVLSDSEDDDCDLLPKSSSSISQSRKLDDDEEDDDKQIENETGESKFESKEIMIQGVDDLKYNTDDHHPSDKEENVIHDAKTKKGKEILIPQVEKESSSSMNTNNTNNKRKRAMDAEDEQTVHEPNDSKENNITGIQSINPIESENTAESQTPPKKKCKRSRYKKKKNNNNQSAQQQRNGDGVNLSNTTKPPLQNSENTMNNDIQNGEEPQFSLNNTTMTKTSKKKNKKNKRKKKKNQTI